MACAVLDHVPRTIRPGVWAIALIVVASVATWMRWFPGDRSRPRTFIRRDETQYTIPACRFLHGEFAVREFINPTLEASVVAGATAVVGGIRRLVHMDPSFDCFLARETFAPYVLVRCGRILSILASVASTWVIARIGRRLFSPTVGVFAGLLLAVDGVAANSAPICGNESMMVLLGLLAVDVAIRGDSLRRRIASGLLLGLAVATKYSVGVLALPLLVAFGLRVVPAALAAVAGFAVGCPTALANFREFIAGFSTQARYLHAGYLGESLPPGDSGYAEYVRTFSMHAGGALAVFCGAAVCASVVAWIVRRRRAHAIALSSSLPLYLYLGSGAFVQPRFLLPAVPFVLLLGGWLLELLLERVPALRSRPAALLVTGMSLLAAAAAPASLETRAFLRRNYGDPDPKAALLAEIEPAMAGRAHVAELAIPVESRLLLPSDPWDEFGLPPPDTNCLRFVREWSEAHGLQPTSTSLARFVGSSRTLADLQENLRNAGIDAILVVVPTGPLVAEHRVVAPHETALRECPYWSQLLDWLASMPRTATRLSPHHRLTAALLSPDLR